MIDEVLVQFGPTGMIGTVGVVSDRPNDDVVSLCQQRLIDFGVPRDEKFARKTQGLPGAACFGAMMLTWFSSPINSS